MRAHFRIGIVASLICALGSVPGAAQDWDVRDSADGSVDSLGMDEMVRRSAESGTTGTTYYGSEGPGDRVLKNLGDFVPRNQETGEEQEIRITVWRGERYFCAYCQTPLRDTTRFEQVTLEQSAFFWDDGTHGDLIKNDGLPSHVINVVDQYIGPRCYEHMRYLEKLQVRAKFRDVDEAKNAGREPIEEEEPHTFYASVKVVSGDPDILNPMVPPLQQIPKYEVLRNQHDRTVVRFEEEVINQYKKRMPQGEDDFFYLEYELHRNEIEESRAPAAGQRRAQTNPYMQAYPAPPGY